MNIIHLLKLSSRMAQQLIYLRDTYIFTLPSKVLQVKHGESSTSLLLEQLIFHPQGGG